MAYYNELGEMYVGDDVSTDFYAWVFPKYDHVAVGTAAGERKSQHQTATKLESVLLKKTGWW